MGLEETYERCWRMEWEEWFLQKRVNDEQLSWGKPAKFNRAHT